MQIGFQTEAFGKWILVGEHSVLRGAPALVFPLKSRSLKLTYCLEGEDFARIEGDRSSLSQKASGAVEVQNKEAPLVLDLRGRHGAELEILFWGVFHKACELKCIDGSQIRGKIILENNIPIGAGMGASAALCVAAVRFFEYLGFVKADSVYEFAKSLENLFHGESSGVDIAVSLANAPLYFERNGQRKVLQINWQPQLYVSYSGQRGVTRDCVAKVSALIDRDPALGSELDSKMNMASYQAIEALTADAKKGFNILKSCMDHAQDCFEKWGLCEKGVVLSHVARLRQAGAAAVKMTGSGGGGFVLSLWQHAPPEELMSELISCF